MLSINGPPFCRVTSETKSQNLGRVVRRIPIYKVSSAFTKAAIFYHLYENKTVQEKCCGHECFALAGNWYIDDGAQMNFMMK